jgi:hypothetical protein
MRHKCVPIPKLSNHKKDTKAAPYHNVLTSSWKLYFHEFGYRCQLAWPVGPTIDRLENPREPKFDAAKKCGPLTGYCAEAQEPYKERFLDNSKLKAIQCFLTPQTIGG